MQTLNLDNIETIIGHWGEFKTNALELLDRMLESYPNNVILLQNRGSVLNDRGEFQEAINNSDKLLEIDSQNITALNSLGYALRKLDRNQDAIRILDEALKIDPQNLNALNNKGVALSNMNKNQEAIELYNEILKIDPSFEYALNNREYAQKSLKKDSIFLGSDFENAINLMNETNGNLFLTGSAGTGKSTAIEYFRKKTKKKIVILAPTGVAALNVGGETIHSFFHFGIDITPDSVKKNDLLNQGNDIYRNIDTIVIDEISMVRADLMDCVDKFMRLNGKDANKPFGGVQIILVGDPYQLPPVVTKDEEELFTSYYKSPYFFDSKVFSQAAFLFVELKKIYRQNDLKFIQTLEAFRLGQFTGSHLELINTRYSSQALSEHDLHINLVSTNAVADAINNKRLSKLSTKQYISTAMVTGRFDRNPPANKELLIKEGSKIMLLKNDPGDRWVNGDLGEIVSIKEENSQIKEIVIKLDDKSEHIINRITWEKIKFFYNRNTKSIETEVIGTFTQFPIKLAWAVTIHKGQGKTYKNMVVNFGRRTFAHGQAYVAISRCQSLGGLFLTTPLRKDDVLIDKRVCEFMESNICSEKVNSKSPENELMGLVERQGQELGEFRKFFSDIAPLLDKLDKSPEIVQAIMNGRITTDIAKALTEDNLNPKEAPEKINPNDIPF